MIVSYKLISLREQVDLTARMTAVKAAKDARVTAANLTQVTGKGREATGHKPNKGQAQAIALARKVLATPKDMGRIEGDGGTGKTWAIGKALQGLRISAMGDLWSRKPQTRAMPANYRRAFDEAALGESCGALAIHDNVDGVIVAAPTWKAANMLGRKLRMGTGKVTTLAKLLCVGQSMLPAGRAVEAWIKAGCPGEPPVPVPVDMRRMRKHIATFLDAGMEPITIAEEVLRIPHDQLFEYTGGRYFPNAGLVLDECSMVSAGKLPLLHEMFGKGVLLTGDTKQLSPIVKDGEKAASNWAEVSALVRAEEAGAAGVVLTEQMRQDDPAAAALGALARSHYERAEANHPHSVGVPRAMPPGFVYADALAPEELRAGLAPEAGSKARVFTPIICAQRKTVTEVNALMVNALGFTGLQPGLPLVAERTGGGMSTEMLTALAEMRETNPTFADCDIRQYTAIETSTLWRVMAVVRCAYGEVARLRSLDVGGNDVMTLARLAGTNVAGRAFSVGFASTAHVMQGDEAPIALMMYESFNGSRSLPDPADRRSWAYVAMTRGQFSAAVIDAFPINGQTTTARWFGGHAPGFTPEALGMRDPI